MFIALISYSLSPSFLSLSLNQTIHSSKVVESFDKDIRIQLYPHNAKVCNFLVSRILEFILKNGKYFVYKLVYLKML